MHGSAYTKDSSVLHRTLTIEMGPKVIKETFWLYANQSAASDEYAWRMLVEND